MATHIGVAEAQTWLETTRANLGGSLDPGMEASISAQVLARASLVYDTSAWVDASTTPQLVRIVIAMKYAAWYYHRQYSESGGGTNEYALMLDAEAENILAGIVEGTLDLPEVQGIGGTIPYEGPAFYPNNASNVDPTYDPANPTFSTGDRVKFTMGKIW